MARARNIKPGFFTNDQLGELPPLARLLFAGLWTLCDREGRVEDRPKKIKAELLPYDACDGDELLSMLADAGFISRYEVGEKRVIQVLEFAKHQNPHVKEGPSSLPAQCKPGAGPVQEQDKSEPLPERAGLIPDSGFLIPSSSVPNGTDAANAPAVAKSKSPEEQSKSDLWRSAVVVLQAGGCQDEATCRTCMGKLVRDYTFPVVQKAVEGAVSAQPVEAREYLKAACQRLKGERADPITVPSAAVDQTAALLAEQAAAAERARSPEAQAARLAAMAKVKGAAHV